MKLVRIIWRVFCSEYKIYAKTIFDGIINGSIWTVCLVSSTLHFVSQTHATGCVAHPGFLFATMCVGVIYFQFYRFVLEIVNDIEYERKFELYAILPVPLTYILLILYVLFPFLANFFVSLLYSPLAMLFSGCISFYSLKKVFFALLVTSLFFASMSFAFGTRMKSREHLSNVWGRAVVPMWFFSCFQYTWGQLYASHPIIALLDLFNPMVYLLEAWRYAVCGLESFAPFYFLIAVPFILSICLICISVGYFSRRFDLV